MDLIVISPESEEQREHAVLVRMFDAGLQSYHLRKPDWNGAQLAAWLRALPTEFHSRIVLHSHHELIGQFALGGLHQRDKAGGILARTPRLGLRSRAVHDLAALSASLTQYDRVLFSPLFPSISKPGYSLDPAISRDELRTILALLRRARVIALGGVDRSKLNTCSELGFDGVAVLGAVWRTVDPVKSFHELQQALLEYAT